MKTSAHIGTALKIKGAVLACALVAACGGESGNPELNELNDARLLWESFGISQYHMSIDISCFCFPQDGPTNVIVDNDLIEVYLGEFNPEQQFNNPLERTVSEWFDEITRVIENPDSTATVTYDEVYGYPKVIHFDNIIGAVDDETSYTISLSSHYELKAQLVENKQLWDSQNLDTYTFNYFISSFAAPTNGDIAITVTDNLITGGNAVDTGDAVDANELKTIDQWFDSLTETSNNPWESVTVEFDAVEGYPITISGGPALPFVDSSYDIRISDVQ